MGSSASRESGPAATVVAIPTRTEGGEGGGGIRMLIAILGGFLLLYLGFKFYNFIRRRNGLPEIKLDIWEAQRPSGEVSIPVDGKTRTVVPAGDIPASGGAEYGIQYWMYIKDWDYKFGQDKELLKRVASTGSDTMGPRIFLSPTDNTLNVRVSLFAESAAGAATPGADTTGDSQTCSVENVPLQSWFSVSMTVFQRNLDIYINGRLVKSCLLTGIPRPATGDLILNDNGGFSGTICNVNYYNKMVSPDDAKAFHSKGTLCENTKAGATPPIPDSGSIMITLFGYTFRFSTIAKDGTELNSYTL
jgi:hypothetical protein